MKRRIVYFLGVITFILFFSPNVYAKTNDLSITSEDLYNLTNTYKYTYDIVKNRNLYLYPNSNYEDYNTIVNKERYDFNVTNNNVTVSKDKPLMTVLTHGLGGDASHWSNDGNGVFAYSDQSLITRLARTIYSNV